MSPIQVSVVPVTPFAQNASVVLCMTTKRAAVVDPGGDLPHIRAVVAELGATVEIILLTHGHIDHAGGATALAEELGVPIEGPHQGDKFLLDSLAQQGAHFGITDARAVTPTRWLKEGDTVSFGAVTLDVLECPGHTPGHVVFVHPAAQFALVGDTLFAGSIGRTDFAYGNHAQLIEGIKRKLLPLGDELAFLPGHGRASTMGAERRENPFLR